MSEKYLKSRPRTTTMTETPVLYKQTNSVHELRSFSVKLIYRFSKQSIETLRLHIINLCSDQKFDAELNPNMFVSVWYIIKTLVDLGLLGSYSGFFLARLLARLPDGPCQFV